MSQVLKLYGPPGTGKTENMLNLFEDELKNTPPNRVAFLTFTRAAKFEALRRSERSQDDLPYLRTIHSICYKQLGLAQGNMMQTKDLKMFGASIGVKLSSIADPWAAEEWGVAAFQPMQSQADVLMQLNHLGRHRLIGLKQALLGINVEIDHHYAKWFTAAYHRWKETEAMMDFTDILTLYLKVGKPLPIDVMFIDEAQDLSALQWQVVHQLGSTAERVYMAGDDDQAIFTWAGASPEQFMAERYNEERFLSQSYRLPYTVLKQGQAIIRQIKNRVKKPLRPRPEMGRCVTGEVLSPSLFDTSGKILVLFRNHWRGKQISEEILNMDVPFAGPHSPLTESRAAIHAWFKCMNGIKWTKGEAKAVISQAGPEWTRLRTHDIKELTVEPAQVLMRIPRPEEWPSVLPKVNAGYVLRAAKMWGWKRVLEPPAHVMSIHQSKGAQADRVILDPVMASKTFDSLYKDQDSEHRVWYVGVTRAKQELFRLMPMGERAYEF